MNYIRLQLLNLREMAVAFDNLCNVIVCMLTGQQGYSDESMSAHAWRAYRDGKAFGRLFRPIIDVLFSWQTDDPTVTDETGAVVSDHCRRAFFKEKLKRGLPPEYR